MKCFCHEWIKNKSKLITVTKSVVSLGILRGFWKVETHVRHKNMSGFKGHFSKKNNKRRKFMSLVAMVSNS